MNQRDIQISSQMQPAHRTPNMAVHIKLSSRRQSSVGNYRCALQSQLEDYRARKKSDSQIQTPEKNIDAETVVLNVGGQMFETYLSTLNDSSQKCKLSDNQFLRSHYRVSHGDYFFDRDTDAFKCVLNLLRTGELHVPTNVCGPAIKRELLYWGVDEQLIERCCWGHYTTWNSQNEVLDELEKDINSSGVSYKLDMASATSWQRFRSRVWDFLENPSTSKAARVYTWVSIMVVIVSIFTFCAETHPIFQVSSDEDILADYFVTDTVVWTEHVGDSTPTETQGNDSVAPRAENITRDNDPSESTHLVPHAALIITDFLCLIFFTIELVLRFAFAPNKRKFMSSALNIIDFIAVLPDYVELVVISLDPDERKVASFVDFIFILRIIRILRIFRLIRHVPGLWILLFTLRASVNELFLMMIFLMIGMLVFAALIYFAEGHSSTDFTNIPIGFWWSLVTMTTVGYGDVYPKTGLGYVVGSTCALVGLLMLALTVPIIVGNFVLYYSHIQFILSKKAKNPSDKLHVVPGIVSGKSDDGSSCDSERGQTVTDESIDPEITRF